MELLTFKSFKDKIYHPCCHCSFPFFYSSWEDRPSKTFSFSYAISVVFLDSQCSIIIYLCAKIQGTNLNKLPLSFPSLFKWYFDIYFILLLSTPKHTNTVWSFLRVSYCRSFWHLHSDSTPERGRAVMHLREIKWRAGTRSWGLHMASEPQSVKTWKPLLTSFLWITQFFVLFKSWVPSSSGN